MASERAADINTISQEIKTFSHKFPTAAVVSTPNVENLDKLHNTPLYNDDASSSVKPDRAKTTTTAKNAGIDYVIVFHFPTKPAEGQSREQLETKVTQALQSLTSKLTKVNLRFQVRPGQIKGQLLILVSCPVDSLEEACRRERVRDILLGIRVNEVESEEDSQAQPQELTEGERLRIIYDILTGPESEGGANISPMLDNYVQSIMTLHDDDFNKHWIHLWTKKWYINHDDLNQIRNQFGEKIAFYFAFLQNYMMWLTVPTVLGGLVYLTHSNTLSGWYSLCMLVWSVLYIEMWKRKEQQLAVSWGVRNCSKYEKRRLDFKGDRTVRDEVTGEEMPYCPTWKIFVRRTLTFPGVSMGAIVLSFIVALVFIIQLFLHEYYNGPLKQYLHYAPTIGYVLLIPFMSGIYSKWVRLLNNWEMHKTETSWEYHYTQKIFVANFLVSYLSLFITAWIYIPFGDHVLPYLTEFNISHEHKKVDFQRLRDQLIYFIMTGQVIGFLTEMVVPYLMRKWMPKATKLTDKVLDKEPDDQTSPLVSTKQPTDPEEARLMKTIYRQVSLDDYNVYSDYVEMVIQFGYVSMFSTVWPLTALCCLVNNWIELRGDAIKVCRYTRAENAGAWVGNLETLAWLSSVTMASFGYMFHPSTDLHSSYTPIFTLLTVLVSEHIYVGIRLVVRAALSQIPSWSDLVVKKEDFKVKKLWLERFMKRDQPILTKRTPQSFLNHGLASRLWSNEPTDSQLQAVQLVADTFKTS
ncbi:calcium-activated chloride channel-domain-containing protein [Radiomyces spectabilis]|uniref:calcium-activated chloride channel-domain-containing protein n=1 Tax=Radiomyces spectabilis TaxID=64574 RepID=UPI00221EEFB4|nr:calcium-activated chloride channel-domain-containing protein [Radiomyces spectabilis]KAI8376171.1 calcium-activated chloride channel-domain-containing protein [Radiomyces spectabilis]